MMSVAAREVVLFTAFSAAMLALATSALAQPQVTAPEPDTVINAASVDVSGVGLSEGASVSVQGSGPPRTGVVQGGRWTVRNVGLAKGDTVLRVTSAGAATRALLVRPPTLASQGPQRVTFIWEAGVDEELRRIARGTLQPAPSAAQLATFVSQVRLRTVEVFRERYGAHDIQVVAAPGPGVHTVRLKAINDTIYGQSPGDCRSDTPQQTSSVHVGTYRESMVAGFGGWRPMRRSDTLATRIEDVSQALGRTSAHETGHSLGLTVCAWMNPCEGGHNCQAYDANQPLANRFNWGWHMMDPGGKTRNQARLAEPERDTRAAVRRPAVFEPFSRSYLAIVHPGSPP